jgi:hypothetical protein
MEKETTGKKVFCFLGGGGGWEETKGQVRKKKRMSNFKKE